MKRGMVAMVEEEIVDCIWLPVDEWMDKWVNEMKWEMLAILVLIK